MGNKASLMLQDEEIKQISDETGFSAQQIEKLYSRFTQLDRANCGTLGKSDLLSIPELAINPLCDRLIEMFFSLDSSQHDDERINFRQFMRVLAAFRTSNQLNNNNHHHTNLITNSTTNGLHRGDSNPSTGGRLSTLSKLKISTNDVSASINHGTHHSNDDRSRSRTHSHQQQQDGSSAIIESFNDCLKDKLYFLFKIYDADNDGRISFNDLKSILKMMVGNYIEDVQLEKIATRAFVEVDRDNDGFVEFGEFCRVFAGKDMDDKLRVRFF